LPSLPYSAKQVYYSNYIVSEQEQAFIMAKLIDFYKQHRRLFLSQKHENISKTEHYRNMIILKFLEYCEANKIFHTAGIKKQTAKNFLSQLELSQESKRKYYLVLREFYKRFKKIELTKDILK